MAPIPSGRVKRGGTSEDMSAVKRQKVDSSNQRSPVVLSASSDSHHLANPPTSANHTKQTSINNSSTTTITLPATHLPPRFASSTQHATPALPSYHTKPGLLLVLGSNETGQLGIGSDIIQRTRPSDLLAAPSNDIYLKPPVKFISACAGGMHSVALTSEHKVVTFGCNDEGALGRSTTAIAAPSSLLDKPSSPKKPRLAEDEVQEQEKKKGDDDPSLLMDVDVEASTAAPTTTDTGIVADETRPGYVQFPFESFKVVSVSAGDSHTAVLASDGRVCLWGTFRGPSGPIGLTKPKEIAYSPVPLLDYSTPPTSGGPNATHLSAANRVVRIASGQDHLVCLTDEGRLYTMGCAEQGQLGRIAERFCRDGGRSGMALLLTPTECRLRGSIRFSEVWAGGFATLARSSTGIVYACGLNNYGQLALVDSTKHAAANRSAHRRRPSVTPGRLRNAEDAEAMQLMAERVNAVFGDAEEDGVDDDQLDDSDDEEVVDAAKVIASQDKAGKTEAALVKRQGALIQFMLKPAAGFNSHVGLWKQFALSTHHTLALDEQGNVYACGRSDYGRLGLANSGICNASISVPSRVASLPASNIVGIATGEACSFAVDKNGDAYSWGMGSSRQLGHGTDDDDSFEPAKILGKQLDSRSISMIDAGGQHTVILAHADDQSPPTSQVESQLALNQLRLSSNVATGTANHNANTNNNAKSSTVPATSDSTTGQPNRSSTPTLNLPAPKPLSSGLKQHQPRDLAPPSDTNSVSSNNSAASSVSSQINSAKSTDGGGSSRCSSSFDAFAAGSLFSSASTNSLPPPPPYSLNAYDNRRRGVVRASGTRGGGSVNSMSRTTTANTTSQDVVVVGGCGGGSTSSEPGNLPTETNTTTTNTSLAGSMNASPVDMAAGVAGGAMLE